MKYGAVIVAVIGVSVDVWLVNLQRREYRTDKLEGALHCEEEYPYVVYNV